MNKFGILLILFYSCSFQSNEEKANAAIIGNTYIEVDTIPNTEIIEVFIDSTKIGIPGKNKIELIKHRVFNNFFTIVKFYAKRGIDSKWLISNTYQHKSTSLLGLDPKISDYNNDGFKDISFISLNAARGSNEVRRLFVYNKREKELISIKNSEDYPNIRYNKDLDCISAFLVSGSSSSKFLNIKNDSLIEFASISFDPYQILVEEKDKFGKWNVIKKDTFNEVQFPYVYFKNYKTLESF